MLLESFDAGPNWRIVLEPQPEGVYVLVYEREGSESPERDQLQDDLEMAKLACREDFGTSDDSWHEHLGKKIMG